MKITGVILPDTESVNRIAHERAVCDSELMEVLERMVLRELRRDLGEDPASVRPWEAAYLRVALMIQSDEVTTSDVERALWSLATKSQVVCFPGGNLRNPVWKYKLAVSS